MFSPLPRSRGLLPVALVAFVSLSVTHPVAAAAQGPGPVVGLEQTLDAIVGGSPIAGARAGLVALDLETGAVRYARDADVLLNPASNVKLVTTAAALARLGPEYRFSTEFLVDAGSVGASGVKTLYVRGRGDPSIVTERLWAMAADLEHQGVRRVGELVLDESFFDGERLAPGYDQETGDRAYLAPAGALSLDFNAVAVYVGPGDRKGGRARVELEPASPFLELDNRAVTVGAGAGRRVDISSQQLPGRQRVLVEGRVPLGARTQALWRKVDEPALFFGHTLARLLELRGVKVGRVKVGAVAPGARLLLVSESEPLAEIVRRLNKTSNNFTAEQLLKTLGAEVKGAPGSFAKGVAAVEDFLAEVGIPRGSYVMRNGSGLNDANRFSARQLATLLRWMWTRFPLAPEYVVSLPVAGRDGTIRWRMEGTEAAGRLRAKTGTLENVTSLSGYVQTSGKETLAFAVLVNDYPGRHQGVVRAVDAVGAALAASGAPAGPGGKAKLEAAIALARGKPPPPGTPVPAASPADLAAAARTYYALAFASDPRNVAFLRTALRAEADLALQLAVAESVYLSDPEGSTARRTFLDAIAPEPLARLWGALDGQAAAGAAPVVPSLRDLAAEGSQEALAKLVELAPATAGDGRLAAALGDALAAAAAGSPEELVSALRSAPPAVADTAIGALGSGLARSEEKDHPFPAALKALAAREDDTGAFARALGPRLAEAVTAGQAARQAPTLVPAAAPPGASR